MAPVYYGMLDVPEGSTYKHRGKVIGEIPYTLTIKGNTVVDMESNIRLSSGPNIDILGEFGSQRAESMLKEEFAPLYKRGAYKADTASYKKMTCFVSREVILW